MTPLYESRQVGWFAIVMTSIMLIFFVVVGVMSEDSDIPVWIYPMLLLAVLPFSFMTVTVTRAHVRVSFLFPWPRKTVRIREIRSYEVYRLEGMQKWRRQVKPLQGRFQLTGGGGIVIHLAKGLPIHISDPHPDKLAKAVARAREKHERI